MTRRYRHTPRRSSSIRLAGKPSVPREESYLGLNKIDEAKEAYMTCLRVPRIADELMTASAGGPTTGARMLKVWSRCHRGHSPNGGTRGGIAAQTASLALGAQAAWK